MPAQGTGTESPSAVDLLEESDADVCGSCDNSRGSRKETNTTISISGTASSAGI